MRRSTATKTVLFLLPWGIALAGRAGVPALFAFPAALVALTVAPGWRLAGWMGGSLLLRRRVPLAFAAGHGLLALATLAALALHLSLTALAAPLFLAGLAGAVATAPRPAREGKTPHGLLLLLLALLLAAVASPRSGFRSDTYDHLGTVRQMTARRALFPGEYFHADRAGQPDPRKGTNHTAFALASLVTSIDPIEANRPFWIFHVAMTMLAFFWLAERVLGGPGPAWAASGLFLLLFQGGPSGEWLFTAAYPGKAGVILFFAVAALGLEVCREGGRSAGRLVPAALGAGLAGIHAFSIVLAGTALAAFATGLVLSRRHRKRAAPVASLLGWLAAGAAPLFLYRLFATYAPANPLHLHRQGVLLLPGNTAILDPVILAHLFGVAGGLSFLLLPFLTAPGKGPGPGEIFLLSTYAALLLLLVNPFLFPLLEERGGYLMRRFHLLAFPPVVLAGVARRGWEGRGRARTALPAAVALVAVLFAVRSAVAGGDRPARNVAGGRPWAGPLAETARRLPPGATVLTDPVSGYVLFGAGLVQIVGVIDQHSSPNDPLAARRLADAQRFLRWRSGGARAEEILSRYDVEYVLINGLFSSGFRTYNAYIHPESFRKCLGEIEKRPARFVRQEAPPGIDLFRVTPPPREEDREEPHRDPPLGGPPIDVPMAGGLTLLEGRLGAPRASPGEKIPIATRWALGDENAGPLPMLLYVRAHPAGGETGERLGFGRDAVRKPWGHFTLGGLEDPYVLWERGERVTDRRSLRIPPACPSGTYGIEVTLDPARFFQVRRLSGLERGAMRSGWTAIDTLEVSP